MLRIFDKYSPNANPANTSYPHGSGKDESISGANDGTPLEMDWYNDILGFSEALLSEAGITASGAADTALTSDRMNAFRIAAMRVETAIAYNNGNVSRVGVIALVTGKDITAYDYIVDGNSLTRWSVGTVTGTFTGDFDPVTGIDSGLSGALTQVEAITESRVSGIETNVSTNAGDITELSTANNTRTKTALNASGSAPIYACRAWVNFNGTGTVAIRASGNVSSITDNGVGDYTVNFTTAMVDTNYSIVSSGREDSANNQCTVGLGIIGSALQTVSSAPVFVTNGIAAGLSDSSQIHIAIFR